MDAHRGVGNTFLQEEIGCYIGQKRKMIDFKGLIKFDRDRTPPYGIYCGEVGKGRHISYFKKPNFKPHLAPARATIEEIEVDGQVLVKMTY